MKLSLLICYLWACYYTSLSQSKPALDSLNKIFQTTTQDTNKIKALNDIAFLYYTNQPDTCILLAQKALAWSERVGYERGKAWAFLRLAVGHWVKGEQLKVAEYASKALMIFQRLREERNQSNAYNILGISARLAGNYEKSLEYTQKSLELCQKTKDRKGEATAYNNIGLVYHAQGEFAQALIFFQKSLAVAETDNNEVSITANCLNIGIIYRIQGNYVLALKFLEKSLALYEKQGDMRGVSAIYNNLGVLYKEQKNYSLALQYYEKSLKIKETIKDGAGIATSLGNIAEMYAYNNQYELAIQIYQRVLEMRRKSQDKGGIIGALHGLAVTYQLQKDYEKSNDYAKQSLQYAQAIKAQVKVGQLTKILYENHKIQRHYEEALAYHELYKQTNDSLFTIEKTKIIAQLEHKMALEKKEQEITLLSKNNELNKLHIEQKQKELEIIRKQAEANRLFALAQREKDKRKADSLLNLAQKTQLEATNLKIQEQKLQAENKARSLEIQKSKEAEIFQQEINYLIVIVTVIIVLFLVYVYRDLQNEKDYNRMVLAQKVEIEAINNNLEALVQQRTEKLAERNLQLENYAFFNAHKLRQPVAHILGLYMIFQHATDENEKTIIFQHLNTAVNDLDRIVREIQEIVKAEDENSTPPAQ